MAVLIQQMLSPDLSFIVHTVNPVTGNQNEIYIELAAGQGEALTDTAISGTPYRMIGHKDNGRIEINAFASLSSGLWPGPDGGLHRETINYAKIDFSTKAAIREAVGRRLTAISRYVEASLQGPQDLEGAIIGQDIYLLQARPQVVN